MNQDSTVDNILEISLSRIKSDGVPTEGHYQNYLVIESESPKCLLKHLPQLKNQLVLKIYPQQNNFRGIFSGHRKQEFVVETYRKNRDNNDLKKIRIVTDISPSITIKNLNERWRNYNVFFIDLGHGFSLQTDIANCSLEETDDNVTLSWGNFTFPLTAAFENLHEFTLSSAVFFITNRLPIDQKVLKNYELFNKLIRTLGVSSLEKIEGKLEGITKTYSKIREFYERETDLSRSYSFHILATHSKMTINNVKSSVIFNKLFQNVETEEDFYKVCDKIREVHFSNVGSSVYFYRNLDPRSLVERLMDTLEDAREIKKAALKRKSSGAFNKIMNDLDFISIDQEKYPLTHEAVHSGDIPLGTFFRKNGDSYFVYNDNWDLWEPMLRDYREITIQIANSCSGRTTYEKDIMSYFYFTLYELPEYLEEHTGKKWKGIPKLVDSANELDPPKAGETGTAKTRSALTPIVDNENYEVTVPYVSMRIGGYQTTYCYGLTYSVLKKGFSYMGNTVTKNVEEKLNGRDSYGLMFYTLTGSSQGRGYPTFLIIFEKLLKTTRVHFHRTHPMRSKGGDYNPIHNWTIGCYKWMIGNVNFERIIAQQGDLAFVKIDKFPEGEPEKVNGYDSHMFETPVDYLPYTKKDNQNVLGYVSLERDNTLNHTEHMTRKLPSGVYEIRQCRSWEANPKGIWSLRID